MLGGISWLLAWLMLSSGRLTSFAGGTSMAGGVANDWWFLNWVWVVPVAGLGFFLLEKLWDRLWTVPFALRSALRAITGYLVVGGLALTALVLGVPCPGGRAR